MIFALFSGFFSVARGKLENGTCSMNDLGAKLYIIALAGHALINLGWPGLPPGHFKKFSIFLGT